MELFKINIMIIFLQILLLIFFSLMVISMISNKYLRWSVLVTLVLFISAQINSIMLGGTIIDFKFYQHLNF